MRSSAIAGRPAAPAAVDHRRQAAAQKSLQPAVDVLLRQSRCFNVQHIRLVKLARHGQRQRCLRGCWNVCEEKLVAADGDPARAHSRPSVAPEGAVHLHAVAVPRHHEAHTALVPKSAPVQPLRRLPLRYIDPDLVCCQVVAPYTATQLSVSSSHAHGPPSLGIGTGAPHLQVASSSTQLAYGCGAINASRTASYV